MAIRDPRRKLPVAVAITLATPLAAQAWQPTGDPLIELEARAGAGGHVEYWPNPASGEHGAPEGRPWFAPFRGLVSHPGAPQGLLDVLGTDPGRAALAASLLQGTIDLASAGSVPHRWRALQSAPELPDLLRTLRTRPAAGDLPAQLQRLAALRWAEGGAVVEVAPELTRILGDEAEDEHLRLAAAQALGALRSRPHRHAPELPPLATALAEMPADCAMLLVVRHDRLPRLPRLPLVRRNLVQRELARQIRLAGGKVTSPQLAGGQYLAELAVVFPYELALHLGNLRLDRSVLGVVTVPHRQRGPEYVFIADGRFDRERIVDALAPGIAAVEVRGPTTEIRFAPARTVAVSAERLVIGWRGDSPQAGAAAAAPAIPAGAAVWLRGHVPAAVPAFLADLGGAPLVARLTPEDGAFRLRLEIAQPAAAKLLAPEALRAKLPADLPGPTAEAIPKLLAALTVTATATGAALEVTDAGLGLEDAVAHVLELLHAWSWGE